jgi:hypothetical protein
VYNGEKNMFGGLKKSASRLAIVAAAGVLSTGAYAADLGGDCCADLEERVAELEATTARKGNRRMSLTVYGWVNKTIMHWNAPTRGLEATSGTYLGLDNTNSATRFGFRGDAKVSPSVKAGYSILLDVASGARTATVSRADEDAGAGNAGADHAIRMRDANVWLESSNVGRVTLGRLTGAGAVGVIDLGGIGNVAPATVLTGNALTFANGVRLSQYMDGGADYGVRQDGLRYDSPVFAGFTVSASIGETLRAAAPGAVGRTQDGRVYGAQLRYAAEFSGVRVAAGIGHERVDDEALSFAGDNGRHTGGALSLMHAPTGLFAQANYLRMQRTTAALVTLEGTSYNIQAGISQNFFGIGKTALYGEYARYSNDAALLAAGGRPAVAPGVNSASDSRLSLWGVGITQDLDAAAMQLYAGYRSHQAREAVAGSQGTIGIFLAGARVNF